MDKFEPARAAGRQPPVRRAARPGGGAMSTAPTASPLPDAGQGRGRRRRHRRRLDGLPPGPPRRDRRAAARAGHPVVRHDVARGRAGRACCGPARAAPASCSTPPSSTSGSRRRPASAPATGRAGALIVARTDDRMTALRRTAATAAAYDLECELLTPSRRGERYPLLRTDDLAGAIWLPGDGTANPTDVTQSLAKGARQLGVARAGTGAGHRVRRRGRPRRARWAAGARRAHRPRGRRVRGRRQLRRPVGQGGRRDGRRRGAPALGRALLRRDRPGRGGRTATCRSCATPTGGPTSRRRSAASSSAGSSPRRSPGSRPRQIPYPFEFQLLDEDWEHFSVLMESALHRLPVLERHRHPQVLQRARELHARQPVHPGRVARRRRLLRRGRASTRSGIASAGGAGRALAQWVVAGSRRRTSPWSTCAGSRPSTRAPPGCASGSRRCSACTTPCRGRTASSTRPGRSAARPCTTGWRRRGRGSAPRWAGSGLTTSPRRGSPGRPRGHLRLGAPALARLGRRRAAGHPRGRRPVRPDVVRQAARARPRRPGPAAPRLHRRRRPAGGLGGLHRHPQRARGYEADVTATRVADDEWLVVTSAASPVRDADWLRRHVAPGWRVVVEDVTTAYAVFGVMGPRSRELLGRAHQRRPGPRRVPVRDEPGGRPRARPGCARPG